MRGGEDCTRQRENEHSRYAVRQCCLVAMEEALWLLKIEQRCGVGVERWRKNGARSQAIFEI